MVLQNNTVLITGGSSGIGLELAKQLSANNEVIICGRSEEKLQLAKKKLPSISTFQCDLSIEAELDSLVNWMNKNHSNCNVLVNNAAIVHTTKFLYDKEILDKTKAEINTNLYAPIYLCKKLATTIAENQNPLIVNITTGLVYSPKAMYPLYNATKAALHSFTQVLRIQLAKTNIKVTEVFFPAVDTPWHKGNPPKIAISAYRAVGEMLKGLEKGKEEIRVGKAKLIYRISRIAPKLAIKKINSLEHQISR